MEEKETTKEPKICFDCGPEILPPEEVEELLAESKESRVINADAFKRDPSRSNLQE